MNSFYRQSTPKNHENFGNKLTKKNRSLVNKNLLEREILSCRIFEMILLYCIVEWFWSAAMAVLPNDDTRTMTVVSMNLFSVPRCSITLYYRSTVQNSHVIYRELSKKYSETK